MAESLKGKVAVISGVGSGFGKATAELFASADQVGLVLIDFNAAALKATADACRASGSTVVELAADVTKAETWQRALKETLDSFGKIDFLINYAGGALKVAHRLFELPLRRQSVGAVADARIFVVPRFLHVGVAIEENGRALIAGRVDGRRRGCVPQRPVPGNDLCLVFHWL